MFDHSITIDKPAAIASFYTYFFLYVTCVVKQSDVYISWKFYCFYAFWTKFYYLREF